LIRCFGYGLALLFSAFDGKGNCVHYFLRKSRFLWLLNRCCVSERNKNFDFVIFLFFLIIWDPRKVKPSKIIWDFFYKVKVFFFFLGTEMWYVLESRYTIAWFAYDFWFLIWWNNYKSGEGIVTILLMITYIYKSKRVHKIGLNWWFILLKLLSQAIYFLMIRKDFFSNLNFLRDFFPFQWWLWL